METFSVIYPGSNFSEELEIRETLQESKIKRNNFIEYRFENFLDDVDLEISNQNEPFAGLPIMAYGMSFKLAREKKILVQMNGSGLDECFCGYLRLINPFLFNIFRSGRMFNLFKEIIYLKKNADYEFKSFIKYLTSIFSANKMTLAQDLTDPSSSKLLEKNFIKEYKENNKKIETFSDPLRNQMWKEIFISKLPRALWYRDRVSMYHSIELRSSFLNKDITNYCFSLPQSDFISLGIQKYILKEILIGKMRKKRILKKKQQVQTPQTKWFSNHLFNWVEKEIKNSSLFDEKIIDYKASLRYLKILKTGNMKNTNSIWQLINLDKWNKKFF